MTFENMVLYSCVGTFLLIVVVTSKIIPTLTQIPRYYAWNNFAKSAGLTFMHGTFFNNFDAPAPKIVGTYRQRHVTFTADTFGKIGFFDSFTQIVIPVNNRLTPSLPKGGLLYVRRTNLRDKFFEEYQKLYLETTDLSSYRIYSSPENLGNFINRHSSFQMIVSRKRFSGLLIREQNLYFRSRNVDMNQNNIRALLDNLCDVAEAFEQYSLAWTK